MYLLIFYKREIRRLGSMDEDELFIAAKEMQAPFELVKEVASTGRLPVITTFTPSHLSYHTIYTHFKQYTHTHSILNSQLSSVKHNI